MAPVELILTRHGESVGNIAREKAEAAHAQVIALPVRDADVPLSDLGQLQAVALGRWLAALPGDQRPDAVWSSTYVRAFHTAQLAASTADLGVPIRVDERLRDRELGVLDMLTRRGISEQYPHEAARRRWLGQFAYRPPGGESWADVALRLRSLLADLDRDEPARRVLIVAHDAVVLLVRYICERLDEAALITIARSATIGNCSVTRLVRLDAGIWRLLAFDEQGHLDGVGRQPGTERAVEPS